MKDYDKIVIRVNVYINNLVANIEAVEMELNKPQPDITVLRNLRRSILCNKSCAILSKEDLVTVDTPHSNLSTTLKILSALANLNSTVKKSEEMSERITKYLEDSKNK
jgi:hypothetical protein